MQYDCGHCGDGRGNIPRDESTSATIFDSFRTCATRRKDKKITRGDAEKMFGKKNGVNRRKTLPVDAKQAETQVRDL